MLEHNQWQTVTMDAFLWQVIILTSDFFFFLFHLKEIKQIHNSKH